MSGPRATVVTSGHPSSCPRMVKAADALAAAGYDVRFVSVDYIDWAAPLDTDLVKRRRWRWQPVRLQRSKHPFASRWVSARQRVARQIVKQTGVRGVPIATVVRAYARTHREIVAAIRREPFDFVYGGTVAALAAVAEAGRQTAVPFALDFEDFHPGESEEADAYLTHQLASVVVPYAQRDAAFVTTASWPMACQYKDEYGVHCLTIHNVTPLPMPPESATATTPRPLQLYWFSQTVGPRRGLEEVIDGIAAAGVKVELHLRGARGDTYVAWLRRYAADRRASVTITLHAPAGADDMVRLCREYDIGLSPEQPAVLNHDLCVSNKVLTYLAAGLAVIATSTRGHQSIAALAPGAIAQYAPGCTDQLGDQLRRWHSDRGALALARTASWSAAVSRFHWEHALERGALLRAVEQTLS